MYIIRVQNLNCPWPSHLQVPAHYCEPNLCAWVVQPVNTWSNIGFLIVAILILRNKNLHSNRYWFALLSFLVFIGSSAYHMTGTFWGKDLDIAGMLLLSSFTLSLSTSRLFKIKNSYFVILFFLLAASSIIIMHNERGGKFFMAFILLTIFLESIHVTKNKLHNLKKQDLLLAAGVFFLAMSLNILDMFGIYCLPTKLISLHALWHLISSAGVYLVTTYYCQKNESQDFIK